jgi:hypothetical protein
LAKVISIAIAWLAAGPVALDFIMPEKPTVAEIERDLGVIADKLLSERKVMGARPPTFVEKKALAIRAVVAQICPHKARITEVIHKIGFQASITALDVVICVALRIEVPLLKVSEIICSIGLDRFCQDPESILRE